MPREPTRPEIELSPAEKRRAGELAEILAGTIVTMAITLARDIVDAARIQAAKKVVEDSSD